jgi:hypothetical protein
VQSGGGVWWGVAVGGGFAVLLFLNFVLLYGKIFSGLIIKSKNKKAKKR